MLANSGLWANAIIMNRKVFNNVKNTDQTIERLKYAGFDDPKNVGAAALAEVFDVDEIIIAGSSKNTANEGATASLSQIWSDEYCMVARIPRTGNIKEPGLGRTLHWSEDGSTIGGTVESYPSSENRGDVIRVRHDVEEKILYVQAGHLLSNITT